MLKNKRLIITAIIIIILIFIAVTILLVNNANKNNPDQTTAQQNNQPSKEVLDIIKNTQTITLGPDGFNPKIITIKSGTRIVWVNKSSEKGSINSDPYPINTYWKFLNLGIFENEQNMSLIISDKGKYTYHNQLKPEQTGTIIVN